jgi:hypothetical protein
LSFRPCLTSFMLTLPIRMSLLRKKSNNLNSPSNLSSFGPAGNALSGTGGSVGFPLIASARRYRARPLYTWPPVSGTRRDSGRNSFAQRIISALLSSYICKEYNVH